MSGLSKLTRTIFFLVTFGSLGFPAMAQVSGDGRQGPWRFNDTALNESLHALNDHIQMRYRQDSRLAGLDKVRQQDEAFADRQAGPERSFKLEMLSEFGVAIGTGSTLDLHLAAFGTAKTKKGADLFQRVAASETGTLVGMNVFAESYAPDNHLRVHIEDDPTLDAYVAAIREHMLRFGDREARVGHAATGASFDALTRALALY